MAEFLQQLINGLSLGAIYALIALGYTMVYGVLRFINFAHSDVFMVGAFAGYYFSRQIQSQSFVRGLSALVVALIVCAILGIVIEKLAYRPLRGRSTLTVLITAIGVSLLLQSSGQLIFGANPKSFPQLFPEKIFKWEMDSSRGTPAPAASRVPASASPALNAVKSVTLSSYQLIVFIVTLVLLFALRFIVMRTKIGTAMRALSF